MRRLALIALLAFATPSQAFEMPEDQAAADFVTANVISTFYHELGHGLIDVLQLAVLGREEDAADTLSAVLMHQVWDEESATTLVYGTANAFWLYASEAEQAGEGVGQRGLADTRQILDQQVAAREQAGNCLADLVFLAEDDAPGSGEHRVEGVGLRAQRRECGAGHHMLPENIIPFHSNT